MNDWEDAHEAEWADKIRTKSFRRARTERKAIEKARKESKAWEIIMPFYDDVKSASPLTMLNPGNLPVL